jgi:hypothetical protein
MDDNIANCLARLSAMPECAGFRPLLADFAGRLARGESAETAIASAPPGVRVLLLAMLVGNFDKAGDCSPSCLTSSNDTVLTDAYLQRQHELSRLPSVNDIIELAVAEQAHGGGPL